MISIRTLATLLTFLVSTPLLLVGGFVVQSMRELNDVEAAADGASEINRQTLILSQLDIEFTSNPRVQQQWSITFASLQNKSLQLLSKAESHHAVLLLNKELATTQEIFTLQQNPNLKPNQTRILSKAMASNLQSMLGVTQRILDQSGETRTRTMASINTALIVSFAGLLSALLFVALLMTRFVVQPVAHMSEAMRSFVLGTSSQVSTSERITELNQIATAFDDMVENLQNTTVSKVQLELEAVNRIHAEEVVRQSLEQLKEAQDRMIQMEKLSAIGTLVGGVAHEINNPLMGLSSYIEYGIEHTPPSKTQEFLKKAQGEVDRIQRLVRNMLVFARIKPTQVGDRCMVLATIRKAVALVEADYARLGIALAIEPMDENLEAVCNEDSLQQALLNLLINARDALLETAGHKAVSIAALATDRGEISITVTDSGPGISDEIRRRIFDPFFTTKPPGKGTGLGLAVSRQMIEAAAGELILCPATDFGGARFLIKLKPVI